MWCPFLEGKSQCINYAIDYEITGWNENQKRGRETYNVATAVAERAVRASCSAAHHEHDLDAILLQLGRLRPGCIIVSAVWVVVVKCDAGWIAAVDM